MEERLREMFREEMSAEQEPPLRGLAEGAVREGRHQQRRRRAWFTAATTGVAAALAVTAFVVLPGNGAGSAGTTATGGSGTIGANGKDGLQNPVLELTANSTSTVIEQPRGPKLPITAAAVVEQLARLIPHGRTSGYAKGPEQAGLYAFGQIYLDTGKGPGMIRAFVYKGGLSAAMCSTKPRPGFIAALRVLRDHLLKAAKTQADRRAIEDWFTDKLTMKLPGCRDLPGGGRVYVGANDVFVDHGNGVTVEIFTPTWLAWNGHGNPPGTVVLTPAEALRIAEYPGWGHKMDASLVREAAKDYPSLPTVY